MGHCVFSRHPMAQMCCQVSYTWISEATASLVNQPMIACFPLPRMLRKVSNVPWGQRTRLPSRGKSGLPLSVVPRRQRIHYLAQVRRARGAVLPRLGRGPRGQFAVLIRPFRHCEVRIRPHPATPGPQQILGPIKGEIEVCRQVVGSRAVTVRG